MRIIVLGCGNIGSTIAADLAENMPSDEVVIADSYLDRAETVASTVCRKNLTSNQLNATDSTKLTKCLSKFDLALGALPGHFGYQFMKAAIKAQVNFVDISFMSENPLLLHKDAKKARVIGIPDCGVAPGLSHMLIGHAIGLFDKVQNVSIMVGGLPNWEIPPLGYTITWSIDGLIDEYTRKAKIVQAGKVVEVDALTGIEEIDFPGIGRLEAFYTDGLRTLLYTVKNVENMWEKTLRYPGHAEKINMLKKLGFLDEHPIKVGNCALPARRFTAKILEEKIWNPTVEDFLAMKVEVSGLIGTSRAKHVSHILDWHDSANKVSAMARTTGYTASIFAQLVANKTIEKRGILPLEILGTKEKIFDAALSELKRRRVKIETKLEYE